MKLTKLCLLVAVLALPASVASADVAAVYKKHCASCHGADGSGNTRMGKKSGARDYRDPKVQASFSDAEALKAILAPIGEQLAEITPLDDETREAIERDGRMWQRFSATYDDASGQLLAFQGLMEMEAGPFKRRVALEARAPAR